MKAKSRKQKLIVTLSLTALVGAVAAFGTLAAFTDQTTNTGNNITSGTVKIDQHAGATTLYTLTNQKPGDSTQKCVRVNYTGSLAASVKLFVSTVTSGTQYNITVERGSGLTTLDSTMSCAGFSSASTAYAAGALGSFPTTYASGVDGKAAGAAWSNTDSIDYRFTITQNDDATVGSHRTATTSTAHTFTWEARNN